MYTVTKAISARAHCFFHQVEGLYIDKDVSFTDLKQVLLTFARKCLVPDTKIRLRPSYFPFTEPSAGNGHLMQHLRWVKAAHSASKPDGLKVLGCGMVRPQRT